MKAKGNFRYDAFISYRNVEPDKTVAARLATLIENFKVPTDIVSTYGNLTGRCFLDKLELSAARDLTSEIKDALKASSHLIVVCSPRTPQSKWVNLEIEAFQQLGRDQNILLLLLEGEPSQSFPPPITGNPLYVDIRSASLKNSLKDLTRHQVLKLVAPIIGCPLDSLIRRHEKQRKKTMQKRMLYGSIIVAIIFALFWKYRTSRKQHGIALAESLLKEALLNEANATKFHRNFLLGIESMKRNPSFEGDQFLRRGLKFLPRLEKKCMWMI